VAVFRLRFAIRFAGFRPEDFFFAVVLDEVFLLGTFAPFALASERPIAIACFLLLTFAPLPLRSVPDFFRFIALLTVLCAFFEYFAIVVFFYGS
jgi:hypothetical protein